MKRKTFIQQMGAAGLMLYVNAGRAAHAFNRDAEISLEALFRNPEPDAHPAVIWFWMNGNISKDGITRDLEAMKAIGISGVYNFDAGTGIPAGPVRYLSDEWLSLKKHAVLEAKRLGLSFTIHNCPGWSASGGPWITPELSMQVLTWSEVFVSGGQLINTTLATPDHILDYYRDVAVLAFPALQGEAWLPHLLQDVTSSSGAINSGDLVSEKGDGVAVWPSEKVGDAWLQLQFKAPYELRYLSFFIRSLHTPLTDAEQKGDVKTSVDLESSDDGKTFQLITTINTGFAAGLEAGNKFITYDVPLTTARFFRLTSTAPRRYRNLHFSGVARLPHFLEKAGFRFRTPDLEGSDVNENIPPTSVIDPQSIIDLSAHKNVDGALTWHAPEGHWTILRIGHTATSAQNRAAPEGGVGLECDKFNAHAFDVHFENMFRYLKPALQPLIEAGGAGLEIDSYEAGIQNWTADFSTQFKSRRGYELLKMLPVLTGRAVKSAEISERFLWDFRRTQADLIAENYYGRFVTRCKENGLQSCIQPYDRGPFDELQIGATADRTMGEMWYGLSSILQNNKPMRRTLRLVSSIAHVNGQRLVAAETFTSEPESSRWQEYPFALKAIADNAFAQGINHLVIHCSVHQPHPTAVPGITLGAYGIHFERTATWWHESKAWVTYLARCQQLLQQGLPVVDIAYLAPEEANVYTKAAADELIPKPPTGFSYDLINAQTLLTAQVKNGMLLLPSGMRYKLLVLQPMEGMSLNVLQKLEQLRRDGLVIFGPAPKRSLGLKDFSDQDNLFQNIISKIWNGISESHGDTIQSKVFFNNTALTDVLEHCNLKADFTYTSDVEATITFTHRVVAGTHIYFLANNSRNSVQSVCTFRVTGLQPEIWNAVSGTITALQFFELMDGVVRVPLSFEPYGSLFILFRTRPAVKPYQALLRNNKTLFSTTSFSHATSHTYQTTKETFTIFFWAKPEMAVMLQTSLFMGSVKDPWTDYYAIYPTAGNALYGAGHAICGIAVGRNGIAVWENATGVPQLALAAPVPIEGWTLIALVYNDNTPTVYVAGKAIATGTKSAFIVHPASGEEPLPAGVSPYNADKTATQIEAVAINEQRMLQLSQKPLLQLFQNPMPLQLRIGKKAALLVWENGHYEARREQGASKLITVNHLDAPQVINGSWQVQFQPNRGAPPSIQLQALQSLHKHQDPGVKYFSGTAIYLKTITISENAIAQDRRLFLDLGRVEVLAHVYVNGHDLGTLWTRPYRLDITDAIKAGENDLRIDVTNLWPNRLIGDAQLPDTNEYHEEGYENGSEYTMPGGIKSLPDWFVAGQPPPSTGRITFTTWKHYTKESPLLESGLIGPVRLLPAAVLFL